MDNNTLKDIIEEYVYDEETLDKIIVLEGDEFADGCIGISEDNHLVYSYERLINSLGKVYGSTTDAVEWLEYNTIRSLPYMSSYGNEPLIIHEFNNIGDD